MPYRLLIDSDMSGSQRELEGFSVFHPQASRPQAFTPLLVSNLARVGSNNSHRKRTTFHVIGHNGHAEHGLSFTH